jgi:hypothetical protein
MTAAELKAALYGHHPAGVTPMPGPWTCIEEYRGIDFLAVSCWSSVGQYRRIGYEVKISRSDLRRDVLKPSKRARAVAWCNEFYFAVPAGLLKPDELAYVEPEWAPEDFLRTPCRYSRHGALRPDWNADPGECRRGKRMGKLIGPIPRPWQYATLDESALKHWLVYGREKVDYVCDACHGKGHEGKSRVELEAPTVWIPNDVGLVTIDGRGVTVVRKSPVRLEVPAVDQHELGQLLRWVSIRPDPRHHPRQVVGNLSTIGGE